MRADSEERGTTEEKRSAAKSDTKSSRKRVLKARTLTLLVEKRLSQYSEELSPSKGAGSLR